MYVKVFSSMYHGSLATVGPWEALVTFQQLLILSDRLGTVDMTAEVISRISTVPRRLAAATSPLVGASGSTGEAKRHASSTLAARQHGRAQSGSPVAPERPYHPAV